MAVANWHQDSAVWISDFLGGTLMCRPENTQITEFPVTCVGFASQLELATFRKDNSYLSDQDITSFLSFEEWWEG